MVAFSKDFSIVQSTSDSDIYAERIYRPISDMTGFHRLESRMVIGENGRFLYDSCLNLSLAQEKKWSKEDCDNLLSEINQRRGVLASLGVEGITEPSFPTYDITQVLRDDLGVFNEIMSFADYGISLGVLSEWSTGFMDDAATFSQGLSSTVNNITLVQQLAYGDLEGAKSTNYNSNILGAGGFTMGSVISSAANAGSFSAFGSTMTFSSGFRAVATRANVPLLVGSLAIFAAEKGSIGFLGARDFLRENSTQKELESSRNDAADHLNGLMSDYNINCK